MARDKNSQRLRAVIIAVHGVVTGIFFMQAMAGFFVHDRIDALPIAYTLVWSSLLVVAVRRIK